MPSSILRRHPSLVSIELGGVKLRKIYNAAFKFHGVVMRKMDDDKTWHFICGLLFGVEYEFRIMFIFYLSFLGIFNIEDFLLVMSNIKI